MQTKGIMLILDESMIMWIDKQRQSILVSRQDIIRNLILEKMRGDKR